MRAAALSNPAALRREIARNVSILQLKSPVLVRYILTWMTFHILDGDELM